MGKPELFKVVWEGCKCDEKKRGTLFNDDYERICAKCKKKLTGVWICQVCNLPTEDIAVETSLNKVFEVTCCPKCCQIFN